jgi:hypothetical protein
MPMLARRLGLFAVASLFMSAGSAQAFCRTYTRDPRASMCPEECHQLGVPTHWDTPHLTYAFNERGFPDIADADLRYLIAESVNPWLAVRCDDVPVGFDIVAQAAPTSLELGPEDTEPNQNVIVYFDPSEWEANDLGHSAYATTQVWFHKGSGQIVGADMMFNGSLAPFGNCPDTGCTDSGPRADIRNVATHEFGHFLGLAHSNVDGATMLCDAKAREITKRTLAQDDIDGLCAAYPPGKAFMPPSSKQHGCALSSRDGASGLLLGLLALLRRQRRKG